MNEFLERITKLSPKRLALLTLDLQQRLEVAEARAAEPIAVIGMGCRFPGEANSPDAYWSLLQRGVDAVTEVPPERWNAEAIFDGGIPACGRSASNWGGFLKDVDKFDAGFFGISRREAVSLDPQQRLLLEVSWEALEHAGIGPDSLAASPTGVFVSVGGLDYYRLLVNAGPEQMDAYSVSGSAPSMAAGRLAYFLGLQGPALTVDTACSSSLVAVHLACQSLRNGECRTAIAGASSLMLSPETTIGLSQAHMLSPRGRCRAFDASADGIVRGEGCGAVVLKRLADARAAGDRILALLRGSAINQDGRSSGITAPNGPAQEALIRETLRRSGLTPSDIDYVEAHGTGTPLGDPIEVRALANVFRGNREARLLIGSVKTNFGHLEMAAGIASLLKVVLALQHDTIPPHLHATQPSDYIDWNGSPLEIATSARPWTRTARVRRAGVSSFGFSGTNAHVIVEEAPEYPAAAAGMERPAHVLALSARDEAALAELAESHYRNFESAAPEALGNICFTANAGRTHFAARAAIVARTRDEMLHGLGYFADANHASVWRGRAPENGRAPDVAFLFTGQGSQYPGMARELYEGQPVFRRTFDDCEQRLGPYLDRPLRSIVFPAPGEGASAQPLLDDTTYTQPALFAIEYALAELWRSWGIVPSVVAGHSVGEYVAACVAGVFSLDDALRLISVRGRLMGSLPDGGAMASVFSDEQTVRRLIGHESGTVSIAAVNGPVHVVVSGPRDALRRILERLAAEGIRAQALRVSHAFHSVLLEPILDAFEREASLVTPATPRITLISNVTGKPVSESEPLDAHYWRQHARQTVRFADSVRAIHGLPCRIMLEIGPHPVLMGMGLECLSAPDTLWLASLRRGASETGEMLNSLARLYTAGLRIDWQVFHDGFPRRRVTVPTYPFQRESYWLPTAPVIAGRDEAWRDWLYTDEWRPVADDNCGLPKPPALLGALEPLARSLCEQHGAAAYESLYPGLDSLCSAYVRQALAKLGWLSRLNETFATAELRERLAVAPGHKRLFERLLEILAEDGMLSRSGDNWRVVTVPNAPDPTALGASLLQQLPACQAEIGVTQTCGERLADVLTARQDPLEILFPGGSLEIAEALYEHAPSMRVFNGLVARVVAESLQNRPSASVLEIGAGTGATVASILPVLPRHAKYFFSDVSSAFTNRARVKFSAWPNVEYGLLDIENDPARQGFAGRRFDIVIASNVLHATARIDSTLANVRSLLAPGGLLILVEATGRQRFGDLTVGLTPGWWRFADTGLRPAYALLNKDAWRQALQDSGFEDVAALPQPSTTSTGIFANMTVVVARNPEGAAEPASAAPAWVLFADRGGVAERLAREIRARGDRCLLLGVDADMRVPAAAVSHGSTMVVNCRSLDLRLDQDAGADAVMQAVEDTCGTTLALAKALISEPAGARVRLIVLTRSAAEFEAAAYATLSGFGRTIWLEHPDLRFTYVDLPAVVAQNDLAAVVRALAGAAGTERELTVRNGVLFRRAIVRSEAARQSWEPPAFRPNATYLVTGGFGGLGLRLSQWLADGGALHLLLAGRSGPGESARSAIDRLRARGVQVIEVCADISRSREVDRVLAAIPAGAPLAGVFHLAGSLDDGVLLEQSWPRFERVMAAKVRGTWLLHQRTCRLPLDHFVLFSSGASFLGSAGQINHAAANAFMDGLARLRRGRGLPGLSINWGAWREIGAAARGNVLERAIAHGLGAMSSAHALKALAHAMRSGSGQIAVLPIEWPALLADRESDPALADFRGLALPAVPSRTPETSLLDRLRDTPRDGHRRLITDFIAGQVARIAGIRGSGRIDVDAPLVAMGIDSLMGVELRNALAAASGLAIEAGIVYDHPSVAALASHMHSLLGDQQVATGQSTDAQSTDRTVQAASLESIAPGPAQTAEFGMSEGQRALRLIYQLAPAGSAYNFPVPFRIRGEASTALIRQALEIVAVRHPVLTSIFADSEEGLAVPSAKEVEMEEFAAGGWSSERLSNEVEAAFLRPFDLAVRAPIRVALFRNAADDVVVLVVVHHIAFDALSVGVFLRELKETLSAAKEGRPANLDPHPVHYGEFVRWQKDLLESSLGDQHREFWQHELRGTLPVLQLPDRREIQGPPAEDGDEYPLALSSVLSAALRDLAAVESTTLFAVLLAAYRALLEIESGANDLVIGVPMAGRTNPRFASVIGYFVNTTPIRVRTEGNLTFRTLIRRTTETLREAMKHQDYPFVRMVQNLSLRRSLSHSPVFQTTFNLLSAPSHSDAAQLFGPDGAGRVEAGPLSLERFVLAHQQPQFEIQLEVSDFGGPLRVSTKYNKGLYARLSIERLTCRFARILHEIVADPDALVNRRPAGAPVRAADSSSSMEREEIEL